MNILITGYSGNLGTAVAKPFIDAGHRVRGLIHGAAIEPGQLDESVEIVWGSLGNYDLFNRITSNVDAVVHCAWEGRGAFDGSLETTNLEGTLRLIEAAERNSVKTFVHISSVGVYGLDRSLWGTMIDEEQPLVNKERSLNPYPWVKVLIENKCKELTENLQMNLILIRPGLLFGDTKAPAKKLVNLKKHSYGILVGNGKNHLPYIHVDDVSNMIFKIIDNPPKFQVYNCSPTNHLSATDFLKKWAQHRHQTVTVFRLLPLLLRLMMWVVNLLKKILGRERSGPTIDYQILTGIRNIKYNNERAIEELGWHDTLTASIAGKESTK